MITQATSWSSLQSLILSTRSTLRMQMLSQIIVWRFQLLYNIGCPASSTLEGHVAMRLIHVVDVVLILHGLSVVLIFEYFREDSFRAGWHA